MSLSNLQKQYPNEIVPTHYEIRSRHYPSYIDIPGGTPIGVGEHTTIVHGRANNLLSALRYQAFIDLANRPEFNAAEHNQPHVLDKHAATLKSHYDLHPATPTVHAVYPDGSHYNINNPEIAFDGENRYIDSLGVYGNVHAQANVAFNKEHRKHISELLRIARNDKLADSTGNTKALRDAALREHDLHSALIAADSGEEDGHLHPAEADDIRERIRKSGVVNYMTDSQKVKYYNSLKKLWSNCKPDKYSHTQGAGHDKLQDMLTEFQSPAHAVTREGGPDADHLVRNQLADALQDQDTGTRLNVDREIELLRDPNQHVMVHDGQIKPAHYDATTLYYPLSDIHIEAARHSPTYQSHMPYINVHNSSFIPPMFRLVHHGRIEGRKVEEVHPRDIHTALSRILSAYLPEHERTDYAKRLIDRLHSTPVEVPV